ncbi:hypothetical protein [Kitasatospora sp. MBT66]|uniref:hypothetical protein n=1 Tax=Kitasatospora sp. MBT66 TaxID=1444769 RepID=UPI0005BCB75F|nr:hypothetical protein [Kitasatospora sp. MBT66]
MSAPEELEEIGWLATARASAQGADPGLDWQGAALTSSRIAHSAQQRAARLLAENARLHGEVVRLTDERAVLAKTVDGLETVLDLAAGENLTLWRAEHTEGLLVLDTYLTRTAAEEHCISVARRDPGLTNAELRWIQDGPDPSDEDPAYLYVLRDDGERDIGYAVTPITAKAAFDPDGDE